MKILNITILFAVMALGIQAQADGLYDITFTDGGADVGSGQINVAGGFATSGYFDITIGPASGNWTLAGGTTAYPNLLTSPSGTLYYDNAVYLTSNPQFPVTDTYLDNGGLLFTDDNNNANEFNLFANANGSFSLYATINNVERNPAVVGQSTITPAPEPSSLTAIALLLVPAGAFIRRKIKWS
jgi:hypothetical protein